MTKEMRKIFRYATVVAGLLTGACVDVSGQVSNGTQDKLRTYNVERAETLMNQEEYMQAIGYLRQELGVNGKNYLALQLIGNCYLKIEEEEKALDAAESVLNGASEPDRKMQGVAYDIMSRVSMIKTDTLSAVDYARKALVAEPRMTSCRELLLSVASSKGDTEEEMLLCRDWLEKLPYDEEAYFSMASAYYHVNDTLNALKYLDYAVTIEPKFAKAYSLRGLIYEAKREWRKAIDDLLVFQLETDNQWSRLLFGRVAVKDMPYVESLMTKSISQDSQHAGYYIYTMGTVCQMAGDILNAIKWYKKYDSSNMVEVIPYRIGQCYNQLGCYDLALKYIREAMKISNNPKGYNYSLIEYLDNAGYTKESIDLIDKMLLDDDNEEQHAVLYYQRGWRRRYCNNLEGALDDFEKAIKEGDENMKFCMVYCAELMRKRGEEGKAVELYEQYIAETEDTPNDEHRMFAFIALGQKEKAEEIVKIMAKESNSDSGDLYNLSCVYSLLGDVDRSLSYFERSLKAGYRNFTHARRDTDLENLRADKRFGKLLMHYMKMHEKDCVE